jgi:hypothetical protein
VKTGSSGSAGASKRCPARWRTTFQCFAAIALAGWIATLAHGWKAGRVINVHRMVFVGAAEQDVIRMD